MSTNPFTMSQEGGLYSPHGASFSFAVVVFVKNEAMIIGSLIDQVAERVDRNNIFVVDGHSTDDTAAIVRDKKAHYLLDTGKGKGAAIRFAITEISRDVLVFMDSDGSHQPQEIVSLLKPFEEEKDVAMVVGSRFMGGSEELSHSPQEIMRRVGNMLSTFIVNARWHVHLTETQNGFRAVRRSAALVWVLCENTFAIEQELTMQCLKRKRKIIEVPSFELKRAHGVSHVVPHKMLPVYMGCFLRNVFSRDENVL
ncbi:MAG: glycosyltransferase family 2 protein [Candidatus Omnitrophica bacterium]|nr:glycosyltransferase family 2 protein [Candidatus Omnitrophota bacterium]